MTTLISKVLLRELRSRFQLDWLGIHGVRHWARVRHNGLLLARETGADPTVIEYFAFVHDVAREHDGEDAWHGTRAADIAQELFPELLDLDRRQLQLLQTACRFHSDGQTEADVTVMTCWDADRLDLGRVGIRPSPEYLCNAAARREEVIAAAYTRSLTVKWEDSR